MLFYQPSHSYPRSPYPLSHPSKSDSRNPNTRVNAHSSMFRIPWLKALLTSSPYYQPKFTSHL